MTFQTAVGFLIVGYFIEELWADIKEPSDLDCNFSDGTTCRWHNDNSSNWAAVDRMAIDGFHSIPRGSSGPGDFFAAIRGQNSLTLESAVLASDTIGCQEGSGSLSFLVWKSSIPAVLRICVRTPPGERGKLECRQNLTDFMGFDWVPITIVTPASTKPFQLVLVALIQRATDTIGIDNITYTSRLCETSEELPGGVEPTAISSGSSELFFDSPLDCDSAVCSFEVGLCDYEGLETTTGAWQIQCGQQADLNSARSAAEGNCYLSVTSLRNDTSQILASRPFFVLEPTFLEFFYFISVTQPVRLSLCLNDFRRCLWQTSEPPRKLEKWWKDRIRLNPGRIQIFFVVDQLHQLSKLGLDDIKLVDMNGGKAKCQVYQ